MLGKAKGKYGPYFTVLVAVSFVVALLIPLPSTIIDMLIVMVIGFSLMLYLVATTITDWDELSTFPSILLLLGIFRVSLSIATTRKILVDGQPGQVIEEFGNFVIGGSLLVGIVIFIILIIFQFVIVNGASRSAEVAARFTLDGMQNKYMSIDLEAQKGFLSEEEAQVKRKKVTKEADFYGAMDGVGKFLKGDVIFSVALIMVNVIFGIIIGVVQLGMPIGDAALRFTTLTIGDGIVTQIGSLLTAIATGLIITRVFDESTRSLPNNIFRQVMKNEVVVYALGGLFIAMGVFTDLPAVPFILIGGLLIVVGMRHQSALKKEKEVEMEVSKKELLLKEGEGTEEISDSFALNINKYPILIETGIDLVPLIVQKTDGATIKDRITMTRKAIAKEVGMYVPGIQFQDNTSLKPKGKYVIKIMGTKVAEGTLKANKLFALKTPHVLQDLVGGEPAKDPIFGEDGFWIDSYMVDEAKMYNYQILDPIGMLVTHIGIAIRKNLHELIQRQQVKEVIDELEKTNPVLVDEIKKKNVDLSLIQKVIKSLLSENISLQDLPLIVEGIIDGADMYKNIDDILGVVREKISLQIVEKSKSDDDKIHAIFIPEIIEAECEVFENGHKGYALELDSQVEVELIIELSKVMRKQMMKGKKPVVMTRKRNFRAAFAKIARKHGLEVSVIAIEEATNVPGTLVEKIPFMEN